jgi:hypothetical protein
MGDINTNHKKKIGKIQISMYYDTESINSLKSIAKNNNRSLAASFRQIVKEYLEKYHESAN